MAPVAATIDLILRTVILAAAAAAGIIALTHWAVRAGHLQPFGGWPRLIRRGSDPLLHPMERRLARMGRNPQEAPWWLFGVTVAGGIVALSVSRWLLGFAFTVAGMQGAPPTVWLRFGVGLLFDLLILMLIVRVVGSWFGLNPYRGPGRPVWLLTNWLVEPIRRRLPAYGPLDLSPLVAWFLLILLRALALSLLR